MKPYFNIVLIEPEIPNNTGNIGRTCLGTNCRLHLVEPLGFVITDKHLKRSGLDYWKDVDVTIHKNWDEWWSKIEDHKRVFFFSTKSKKSLYDHKFQEGDWLVFGKETKGLGEEIIKKFDAQTLTIPQYGPIRSLNLANAAAVVIYEGLRQIKGA